MLPALCSLGSQRRLVHRSLLRSLPCLTLGIACLASIVLGSSCKKTPAEAAKPAAAANEVPKTAAAAAAVPDPVRKLLGKWLRADGGYVLELRSAELSGVLQAAYFNPKSINVSRAIWMQGPTGFQVVVELNDVGYPGATYVLSHDAQADRLVGQYNQPAMQQSFDIEFVRQPKP
jgi:hypothetical protein